MGQQQTTKSLKMACVCQKYLDMARDVYKYELEIREITRNSEKVNKKIIKKLSLFLKSNEYLSI